MSKTSFSELNAHSVQYRRGAVMGLTIAEVFILLSFILLLLMALWLAEEKKRTEILLGELKPPSIEAIRNLNPSERKWLIDNAREHRLSVLIDTDNKIKHGARLIERKDLVRLVDEIEGLPRVHQDAFIELINIEGYEKVIDWAHEIANLIDRGRNLDELNKALAIVDELRPNELNDIELLKTRLRQVRQHIRDSEDLGRKVAEAIGQSVGDLVGKVGGEIDLETGAVTLPEAALFDQGSSKLKSETITFLNTFCLPWMQTLSKFGSEIDSLQIEGHASTEWGVAVGPRQAFLNNMYLSQNRASAVLNYCLQQTSNSGIADWAQARLVAVGFSSAKPVLNNGVENAVKSRRVIFRSGIDKANLIKEIEQEVSSIREKRTKDPSADLTNSKAHTWSIKVVDSGRVIQYLHQQTGS